MENERLLALLAPLLVAVAACGAGDPGPEAPPPPAAVAPPRLAPPPPATTAAPPPPTPGETSSLVLPVKLSGADPVLPEAARATALGKTARARCAITVEGAVTDCRIVSAPPGTEEVVLATLSTWRYRPAILQGKAIPSQDVIDVAFALAPATPPGAPSALPDGGAPPAGLPSSSETVLDFQEGMARPTLVQGKNPDYTPEARAAGVQGTVVARCIITVAGTLKDCKLIKSLPPLDEAVLDALATQVYTPVVYKGQPVNVKYVLTFKFRIR